MARSDQITRQWHLLGLLEGRQGRSFQQLAQSVPDDYPNRSRKLDPLNGPVGTPWIFWNHTDTVKAGEILWPKK